MKVMLSQAELSKVKCDLLVIGIKQGNPKTNPQLKKLDELLDGSLFRLVALDDFQGKSGETLRAPGSAKTQAKAVLLMGLGEAKFNANRAKIFANKAASLGAKMASVAVVLPEESHDIVRAAAEGLITGSYKYTAYLTGDRIPKRRTTSAELVVSQKKWGDALKEGLSIGASVNLCRDLVNAPPNDLTPTKLADVAAAECKALGIKYKEWDKKALEKLGMNLFLAVNRGSAEEPRMVHMVYSPKGKKPKKKVAFVGKGLTFDSGGLCIKPAGSMIDMKCDMAGAAVTLGIVLAAAKLELPIEIHAIFGATENMTGDKAYRPGDVFKSYDGRTVEIINTDAEGRLVLADVLTYAKALEPDYLIDHATLTGACIVALGPYMAGLYSNDDELANAYKKAGDLEAEQVWRMPLSEDLRDALKSDIADMKHMGDRNGGSITAALFLREFVGKTKWLHMDIAGPAFLDRSHAQFPKGGTGYGVAMGVRFLELLAK